MTSENLMQNRPKSTRETQIDQNLKRAYEDVLNEAVPDRLTQLLEQLKAQDRSPGKGRSGGDA